MAKDTVLAEHLELLTSYQKVATDYGLHFKEVFVERPGDAPRDFLVFSLHPIKDDVDPVAIMNRNHRNNTIFYPDSYVVELPAKNPLSLWEGISNYLSLGKVCATRLFEAMRQAVNNRGASGAYAKLLCRNDCTSYPDLYRLGCS